jgi:hypothetical protein
MHTVEKSVGGAQIFAEIPRGGGGGRLMLFGLTVIGCTIFGFIAFLLTSVLIICMGVLFLPSPLLWASMQ